LGVVVVLGRREGREGGRMLFLLLLLLLSSGEDVSGLLPDKLQEVNAEVFSRIVRVYISERRWWV
jgi:hypothetical protein